MPENSWLQLQAAGHPTQYPLCPYGGSSAEKRNDVMCRKPIHALRYDRRDACLIAVNRVWRGCWKLDTKTRSIGSARRDRKEAAMRFDD